MRRRYRAPVEPDVIAVAGVIAALTLAAIVLAGILVLVAIGMRFSGRRPGRRLGTIVVFLFGVQVGGFIVFLEGDPVGRAVTIALGGFLAVGLLWQNRRVQAGAFITGTALPWALVWGYYTFELIRGADGEPFQIWTMFLFGLVPTLIGLGLMVAGDPLAPEPSPTAPAGQPDDAVHSRRADEPVDHAADGIGLAEIVTGDRRDQVELGDGDEAPVEAADDEECCSDGVERFHDAPPFG